MEQSCEKRCADHSLDGASLADRKSPAALALLLIRLFDERFGGADKGRFRISRKFLRKLAGRRRLPEAYLALLAEEIFEAGFIFVDCESYSIVLSQKQFASYRRVTGVAAERVLSDRGAAPSFSPSSSSVKQVSE